MNKLINKLILLFIFQFSFLSAAYSQTAVEYKDQGIARFNAANYTQAIVLLSKSIAIDSTIPEAYLFRGKSFLPTYDYDFAIPDFTKAIELDPNNAEAYLLRALSYNKIAQYTKAIEDYNKVIALQPQNITAYYERGIVYKDLEFRFYITAYEKRSPSSKSRKSLIPAIADLTKVIELDPQNEQAYYNRAEIYFEQGKYPEALADYLKAIDINPASWEANYYAGYIYFLDKDYEEAIRRLTYSIRINPDYNESYYIRGQAYYYIDDMPHARQDLEFSANELVNDDAREFLEEHFR